MKMISAWKQLAICSVLIVGAGLGWQNRAGLASLLPGAASESARTAAQQRRSSGVPVIVAATETVQDNRTFTAIGTGFAARSVTLRAPSGGMVTELMIASSRTFAQGEVLLRLEDADERFAVSLAETRLARSKDERDRYRRLQNSGAAATARYEQAQTDFKVAEIALEQARADLDDRVLRAPFNGIAGIASVEAGDRIATDDPIASFDDRSRILVEFDLPEALLSRIRIDLPVTATTPAVEGRSFDGEVALIDSRIDPTTRTARVRAAIANVDDLLRPGASFSLVLDLPGSTFPAVPELALQFSDGALHVWRVSGGTVERVPVRLVQRRNGRVIVDGPLSAGDRVVVEGIQRLRSGSEVHVLNSALDPNT